MPYFIFIYEDSKKNEICKKLVESSNLKEAKKTASNALAVSQINELYRIRVRKPYKNEQ